MVRNLPWQTLAYGLRLLNLRKSQYCGRTGRILPISTGRIVVHCLDTLKYESRLSSGQMTGYGRCCDHLIVAKNWKFCPYGGCPLLDGEPVTLRERISTGMNDALYRPDGTARKSPLTGKATLLMTKQCKHIYKRGEHKGKRCKRLDEHKGKHQPSEVEALLDF